MNSLGMFGLSSDTKLDTRAEYRTIHSGTVDEAHQQLLDSGWCKYEDDYLHLDHKDWIINLTVDSDKVVAVTLSSNF
ncbi:hypothetical protein [Ralstonia phage RP13]|nr:hypothetical protein [Ralstonia phage RP13]